MNEENNLDNNTLVVDRNPLAYATETTGYGLDTTEDVFSTESLANLTQPESIEIQADTQQLVFIDSTVEDIQTLTDNISGATEVIVLNNDSDELLQITEHLSKYEDLDAIHIVSHGETGQLSFGNATLNSETLPEYEEVIEEWSLALDADADLLLYGCDVTLDGQGHSFIQQLSQITDADIAASVDLTGSGGDWELETAVGEVETSSAFNDEIAHVYEHTLVDAGIDIGVGGGGGGGGDFNEPNFGGGGDVSVEGNNDSDGEDDDDDDDDNFSFPGDDLFNANFYLEQNPDVAASGIDPLKHYAETGRFEGRDPNPTFDTSYYLERNPDVAADGGNPLEHYNTIGRSEGRYPNQVFESFGEFGANEGVLVVSENLSGTDYDTFRGIANSAVEDSDVTAVALPVVYYTIVGGIAVTAITLELIRSSIDLQSALQDAKIYTFPGGEGDIDPSTPPFDLGEATRVVEKFPNGDQFLDDILNGQFEFPNAEESGPYFLASSPISGVSDDEYTALIGTGLSESEISEQIELLGDIYVFRGTSEGFPGNPALERLGISPASVDPFVATVFGVESKTKGGNGVVLYGSQEGFGNPAVELGNVRRTLEREVSVGLTPTEFAAAAPNSISVDRARQILQEIGFNIPSTLNSDEARNLLENTPKLSPKQIQEFINKAANSQ